MNKENNKKLNNKKEIGDLLQQINIFDKKNLLTYFKDYSKLYNKNESDDNANYKNELIKKIKEGYYTFQPAAKNKKFSFIKTIVYKQLFKYLHKQIHFNDYLKSIIELYNNELETIKTQRNNLLNLIAAQETNTTLLDNRISDQETNIIEQNSKTNAIYEIQKRILIDNKSIRSSTGSAIFFSQFGEDQWIVNNLKLPKKGFFIDVGAADGITFSNSYYFEKHGWEGICFEPNPENYFLANKFRKNVQEIAISKNNGKAYFEIDPFSPDLSSLANKKDSNNSNFIVVKTQSLDQVISKNKINKIDLLSIDVEGSELDVLDSFNILKKPPQIIIVEFLTKGNKLQKNALINYFKKLPYSLVHQTKSNFIFKFKEKNE